jgi:hypothetical protein
MWGSLIKKYGLLALVFRLSDHVRRLMRMQGSAGIEVNLTP